MNNHIASVSGSRRLLLSLPLVLGLTWSWQSQAQPESTCEPYQYYEDIANLSFKFADTLDRLEAVVVEWDGADRLLRFDANELSYDLKRGYHVSIFCRSEDFLYLELKTTSEHCQPLRLYIKVKGKDYACYYLAWCPYSASTGSI